MERSDRIDELARLATTGDLAAKEQLIAIEAPRLRGFVRLRAGAALRPSESAADVVQSVMREALAEAEGIEFRGVPALRAWLFRAAERKLVDRARRAAAVRRGGGVAPQPLDEGELAATYASLVTPSRHAMAREELERFEKAFATLAAEHREVILLARIVGLPHAAIATELGRTEGAVRVLLFRALAELAERMRGR
jgi:RNA polymerase sigma-70 factor (ECF subfamily)